MLQLSRSKRLFFSFLFVVEISTQVPKLQPTHFPWPAREIARWVAKWTQVTLTFSTATSTRFSWTRPQPPGLTRGVASGDHTGMMSQERQETWPAGWAEGHGRCLQRWDPSGHGNMPYSWKSVSVLLPSALTPPTYWGSSDSIMPATHTHRRNHITPML